MCIPLEEDSTSTREEIEAFLNGSCLYCPDRDQCPEREQLENRMVLEAITVCPTGVSPCIICPYMVTCVKSSLATLGVI